MLTTHPWFPFSGNNTWIPQDRRGWRRREHIKMEAGVQERVEGRRRNPQSGRGLCMPPGSCAWSETRILELEAACGELELDLSISLSDAWLEGKEREQDYLILNPGAATGSLSSQKAVGKSYPADVAKGNEEAGKKASPSSWSWKTSAFVAGHSRVRLGRVPSCFTVF